MKRPSPSCGHFIKVNTIFVDLNQITVLNWSRRDGVGYPSLCSLCILFEQMMRAMAPSSAYGLLMLTWLCLCNVATAFHWPGPLCNIKHLSKFADPRAVHSIDSALLDRSNENSSPKHRPSISGRYTPKKGPTQKYQPAAKPKRLPENRMKPRVERPVRGEDRVPMDTLYVGQRLKGRIINVLE